MANLLECVSMNALAGVRGTLWSPVLCPPGAVMPGHIKSILTSREIKLNADRACNTRSSLCCGNFLRIVHLWGNQQVLNMAGTVKRLSDLLLIFPGVSNCVFVGRERKTQTTCVACEQYYSSTFNKSQSMFKTFILSIKICIKSFTPFSFNCN